MIVGHVERRLASLALAALVAILSVPPAFAQSGILPKVLSGATETPAEKKGAGPATGTADLRDAHTAIPEALVSAQSELDAIEASPGTALDAPPDTPANEIADRLVLARQLPMLYQQQLDLLDRTDTARRQREEAEQALQAWSGLPTPPPYSVLFVDGLRDNEAIAQTRIESGEARRALFERFALEIGAKVTASQAAARLAVEAAERARGTPAAARQDWLRSLAVLRARVDETTQTLLQMGLRNAREESAVAIAVRDLARRQLAAVGADVAFPAADRERVAADLDKRRADVARAIEGALRTSSAAVEARADAEKALADARAAPVVPGEDAAARAARVARLVDAAELRREEATTATLRVDLLKGYKVALDGEGAAWQARADAIGTRDPVKARAAYERLSSSLATVGAWRQFLDQQLAATRDLVAEQEARLRAASDGEAAHAQRLLDTFRQRDADLRQARASGEPLVRLLSRFRSDFEDRRDLSLADRARDTVAGALLWGKRAWTYELFTVEDVFETADGRKIEVARSVTIGKTAGAVLIVVVGYWLCSLLARRVERYFVKRGRVAPQSAALLRNWVLFLAAAALAIFALFSASIPLTAFAFLGGALAIAAGFGLQTLLKNLVAGIMLLLERPMRLDDLVEVDGIRGRVTAIGIRASTITTADGIETMIPNSAFIENKLTNWTYTTPRTRHTAKIGVAYGTPLRKAADALLGVLHRHGQVLKSPAPEVYLDDYGDSAITFALTYWVDMAPGSDSRRVKSDILHMIDTAFADAGLTMPFPQRDVHLDLSSPLEVVVVPRPGATTGTGN
jgi:potassium-dependent mechanosensitive channel